MPEAAVATPPAPAPAAPAPAAATPPAAAAPSGVAPAAAPTSILGPGSEPAKPTVAPAATPKAPEKYADFKLPEGRALNKEAADKFAPLFKELDLSQENAQKLVDAQVAFEDSIAKAQVAALDKQNEAWVAELRKGWGADFDKHAGFASKGIEGVAIKGLREFLQESGLSNHPLLVQAFAKIGAEFFSEAQPSTGRTDNGKSEEKTLGQALYPNMKTKPDGQYGRG